MRCVKATLWVCLAAAAITHARPIAAVQTAPAFDAYREVCAREGRTVITEIQQEIKAARAQPAWTPAEERTRFEVDFREAWTATAEQLQLTERLYAQSWKESSPFIEQPSLLLMACSITVAQNWKAGVHDVAGLTQKWSAARASYAAGSVPPGGMVAAATSGTPAAAGAPSAAAGEEQLIQPVDCVGFGDRPGVFKNNCDFDVYFTYCGIDPEPDSYVTDCANKPSFGLIDIPAKGVQAAFTRAKRLHFFECRSPRTPQEAEFKDGKIYAYCR